MLIIFSTAVFLIGSAVGFISHEFLNNGTDNHKRPSKTTTNDL